MAAPPLVKNYIIHFGAGNPADWTGLSPTFTIFTDYFGFTTFSAPSIAEVPAGSGLYHFQYGATASVIFLCDGGSGVSPANQRYIQGVLDPSDSIDQKIGLTTDSYGSTATDPTTLFGYMRRFLEFKEGDNTSLAGLLSYFNRTSLGTTTLLRTKQVTDGSTGITKNGL